MMKNKITTVVFDQETISRLKSIAKRNNKSTSFLIREAVTDYLEKNYPRKNIGIIGIAESSDPEFAKNDEQYLKEKWGEE